MRVHIAASEGTFNHVILGDNVVERLQRSKMMTATGSTIISNKDCELFEEISSANIGSTSARKPKSVSIEMLSKIWRIDHGTVAHTLKVATQLNKSGESENSPRPFGTNDRMMRYCQIKSEFYTYTFFVTGKAHSNRGYTCI